MPRYRGHPVPAPYLRIGPLPGLQDGGCLVFVPADVRHVLVPLEVLVHLLRGHELKHGLQGMGTAPGLGVGG